jgi:uncharacterized protein
VTVWADADSLPREVRDIIARRAASELARDPGFRVVFVANRDIGVGKAEGVSFILAGKEEGAADELIRSGAGEGDLVVTRDIPLAERLIGERGEGIGVVNDRGGRFTADSVRERRSLRDAMLELSLSGLAERKSRTYGRREAARFAASFDAEIARLRRRTAGVGA